MCPPSLSERKDSNLRPLDPQSSALPSCATLRERSALYPGGGALASGPDSEPRGP